MDRTLITPFFLDRPSPEHLRLSTTADWVNRPRLPEAALPQRLAAIAEPLAEAIRATVTAGDRPISIAGDCCTVIGVIAGLQRAGLDPRLLWLDAHGDFNTAETTPSGFIGGMPLAMLVGRGDQSSMAAVGARPLDEANVTLCDARDLDPGEREALAASRVRHVTRIEDLLALPADDRPLHVHLDCDIIDPADAPAMAYPARGGPRLTEFVSVLQRFTSEMRPTSVSVTTWDFSRDVDQRTEWVCLQAVNTLLGTETLTDRSRA
jgi:arginase